MISLDVLMLVDNPADNDRRVLREAQTLSTNGYKLVLLALKSNSLPEKEQQNDFELIRFFENQVFKPFNKKYMQETAAKIIEQFDFKLIHAHDQTMLNLAVELKKLKPEVKLVYDSHELFHAWPLNYSNSLSWSIRMKSTIVRRLFTNREKRNSKFIDNLITVNKSLADNLKSYFGVKNEVLVLRNIPELQGEIAETNWLRNAFKISPDKKILVFIGSNIYEKTLNLEQVIDEFKNHEKYVLIFVCGLNINSKPIQDFVKTNKIENVFFHDKVKPSEIKDVLSGADAGLVPTWNKKDLSYWFALDNKLFEYIHSGIPVLATQQPEYIQIVDSNACGVCVNPDEKNAYLKGFEEILANQEKLKDNVKNTVQLLNWELESQKLLSFYTNIKTND